MYTHLTKELVESIKQHEEENSSCSSDEMQNLNLMEMFKKKLKKQIK